MPSTPSARCSAARERSARGRCSTKTAYKQAKPIFDSAVAHIAAAGTDLRVMRAIINMVLDKFGAASVNNMKRMCCAIWRRAE
jgi:hypothetical protein